MDMRDFSKANRTRSEAPDGFNHTLSDWSLSDWMTATLGELGEAANVLKKLNRARDNVTNTGDAPVDKLVAQFADEVADTFIYLDLMAQAAGFSLREAVIVKFNKTSRKHGYPIQLSHRGVPDEDDKTARVQQAIDQDFGRT